MHLSVIIPALNEAARIEETLQAVHAQPGEHEVIVVDGSSIDATRLRAARRATVLVSAPGRARQMNAGAERATGDVLLFLHADTLLPPDALAAIRGALAQPDVAAGTFRLAFDRWTPLLRLYSACTALPLASLAFGDRGLFVRRSAFDAVGGFPNVPVFEDLEIVRRLQSYGRFRYLPQHVTTSARRFAAHGPLRQQLLNAHLWTRYQLGEDPEALAGRYRYEPAARGR